MTEQDQKRSLEQRFWKVYDWLYGGDRDTEISHMHYKAVLTRASQVCCAGYHVYPDNRTFKAGTMMIREAAIVDGRWASCHTCRGCILQAEQELSEVR